MSRGRAANNRTDLGQISNALGLKLGVVFDRVFRAQSIQFYQLLGVTLFLVGFGVVMVLSASSIDSLKSNNNAFSVFGRQFAAAGVSLVLMSIVSLLPMARIRTLSFMAAVAALGLRRQVLREAGVELECDLHRAILPTRPRIGMQTIQAAFR